MLAGTAHCAGGAGGELRAVNGAVALLVPAWCPALARAGTHKYFINLSVCMWKESGLIDLSGPGPACCL